MNTIRYKVLFVCVHNSARSQMAEAYLNNLGGENYIAESAGLEAGILNPNAVEVMQEDGIDISASKTKSAFGLLKDGRLYNYVITVCDESSAEQCPVFPGVLKQLHWSFSDPSTFAGTSEDNLSKTREVRNAIKSRIKEFIAGNNLKAG
ncbi:MAG: arsenate reductase ArsC [Fimbriimonadaceae bacterium]|nr:arsenate reductase ArsC [Chitinophagales bacterium]